MSTTPTHTTGLDVAHVLAAYNSLTIHGNSDRIPGDHLLAVGDLFSPMFAAEVDTVRAWIADRLAAVPPWAAQEPWSTDVLHRMFHVETGEQVPHGAVIVALVLCGAATVWCPGWPSIRAYVRFKEPSR